MISLDRNITRTWMSLTARRVLTTLAMAASLSSPSSWIGAFLISSLNCGVELLSLWELHGGQLVVTRHIQGFPYKPASRSASVIASRVEGGTEKPSASFSGSALGSAVGGGDNDSFNSGIDSCVVPLTGAAFVSISLTAASFGSFTSLEGGGCSGDGALSDSRLEERRLRGERGRSDDEMGGGTSFSLFLPFPKPNAEPRFEDDFWSGEDARP